MLFAGSMLFEGSMLFDGSILFEGYPVAGGRVVFVGAELHTLAMDATPDFVYKSGPQAGTTPYCRYATL